MIRCPLCCRHMQDLGNLSGSIYLTHPISYDNTFICTNCKVKKVVRTYENPQTTEDLKGYVEL